MKRIFKIFIELIAALIALVIIAVMLVAWRLTMLPINATSFTPYLEKALMTIVPNTLVHVDGASVVWNNEQGSLTFLAKDIRLDNLSGDTVALVPSANVEVSVPSLLRGRFIPSVITVSQPQFWVTRDAKGLLTFGLHDAPDAEKQAEVAKETDVDMTALAATFAGLARELTHKKLSHALNMTDATLSIHDDISDRNWSLRVPTFSVHHEGRRLAGEAKVAITQKESQSTLDANFVYDRNAKSHVVSIRFSKLNPSFLAGHHPLLQPLQAVDTPLDGEVLLRFAEDFTLMTATSNLKGGAGSLMVPQLWEGARKISSLGLGVQFDKGTKLLKLSNAVVDFGGPKLQIDALGGPVKPDEAEQFDMAFSLRLALTDLPMSAFGDLWPQSIIPNVRLWIMANMTKGHFPGGDVLLKGKLAWNNLENMVLESGEGKISAVGGRVTYMDGMPAVDGVNADAVFDLEHMDVRIQTGSVGAIRVQPFVISLLDFQKPIQRIEIPLKLKGPVPDVLKLMDSPPLGYAKAIGVRPEDCNGNVEGVLTLKFPLLLTLALADVDLGAQAKMADFSAQGLIPSLDISQGDLDLSVTKDGFSLKGPVALNTVPFQAVWLGNFDSEARNLPRYAATISGTVKQDQWKALNLDILDGRMEGDSQAVVKFVQPRRDLSQLSGDVNIKQAKLSIPELNWVKQAGIQALVQFAVDMPRGKDVVIKNLDLQMANVKAKGRIVLDEKTLAPLSVEMKPLVLGHTNANLVYTQTLAPKRMEHYAIDGEALDISGVSSKAEASKKGEEGASDVEGGKEFVLKLGRLYSGEDNILYQVKGVCTRDALGWSKMALRALTDDRQNAKNKLDVNLGFYDGKNVLNINADDFGSTLKALGYTDTVREGSLEIRGTSLPNDPRKIMGKINVNGFGVRDLPVLARLMSAASPFGFADLISGEASFDYMRGRFVWKNDVIELDKVRLLGSSYGININGTLDQKSGVASLHGTLVPFSFLNSIINAIPMLGGVITGGDGQGVLAASYTLKGPLTEPDISVNPISLLTPGFLRNLFFSEDK